MGEQEFLTQEKYDELKAELEVLRTEKRKEIAEKLEYAKALGDLSENAEYHEARDSQAALEDRIGHLEMLLKKALIAEHHKGGEVGVSSVVKIKKNGEDVEYTIVGAEEADIVHNKISIKSPFGEAIIGKKKGETFKYTTPNGEVECTILDVK